MRILTHRVGPECRCLDCDLILPAPTKNMLPVEFPPVGADIAVIQSKTVPWSSYVPGTPDSNLRCTE